jgi:hypothetical protein
MQCGTLCKKIWHVVRWWTSGSSVKTLSFEKNPLSYKRKHRANVRG